MREIVMNSSEPFQNQDRGPARDQTVHQVSNGQLIGILGVLVAIAGIGIGVIYSGFNNVNTRIDDLAASLRAEMAATNSRIDDLATSMNARFDDVNARFDSIAQR